MKKHAYLIMYHEDLYNLERLLKSIDHINNDIYLHIDSKVKNFNYKKVNSIIKNSQLYYTKRINVKWSTYSQIKCELLLLKKAYNDKYSYYHLLSGRDLLIKNTNQIYQYFEKNYPMEYISYKSLDTIDDSELARIKYYHILNSNRRNNNPFIKKISSTIYYRLLNFQNIIKVDRIKNNHQEFRKGANWFSITDKLVGYILTKEKEIKKTYKYTNCADEIFLQTIAYNSPFKNNIMKKYSDEHQNAKRHIDWTRGQPYTYTIDDYQELINSKEFFARKFSSEVDVKIIDKIANYIKEES